MKQVFISWCRETVSHSAAVSQLADRLAATGWLYLEGITEAAGADAVRRADMVLVVCSPGYQALLRRGDELFQAIEERIQAADRTCLAVCLTSADEAFVPPMLADGAWYRADTPEGYQALLLRMEELLSAAPETAPESPAAPSAEPPQSAGAAPEEVMEEADGPVAGSVLYSLPSRMQVATRYPAIVRITPAHEEETLLRDLEESLRSQAQIQNIPITRLMVVELLERDADALFDIQALSTPEQPVGVEGWGPTQWDYYITPRRAGQSLIIVRVMAVVILPGFGERRRDLLVFEQDVEVSAHLPSVGDTPLREPQVQPLSPKSLIALGEISSALDILARTLAPAWQNDLILLQARHAALQHDIQAGILSQEQIQLQRNQLIYHLLQLIDKASGGS